MVIAAAKTGKDNNNNTAVITTAHPNKDNLCNLIPGVLIFAIVVMTLNDYILNTSRYNQYCGLYLQRIYYMLSASMFYYAATGSAYGRAGARKAKQALMVYYSMSLCTTTNCLDTVSNV